MRQSGRLLRAARQAERSARVPSIKARLISASLQSPMRGSWQSAAAGYAFSTSDTAVIPCILRLKFLKLAGLPTGGRVPVSGQSPR
jgi:hypothetical protein